MADGVFGKDGIAPISENTMNFDYYYGIEAEQFSFYRVPRLLIKDERFKGLSSDANTIVQSMWEKYNQCFSKANKAEMGISQLGACLPLRVD